MHRRRGPEQLNVWGVSISTSRSLIAIDKLGLLLYRWSTVSVGGNRQAAADKHLDPIQTISLCLLQEARSDRSKRAGGAVSMAPEVVSLSLSFILILSLLPPSLLVSTSQFSCE